jgi:mono/diheme cytochrome c family protein
MFLCMTYVLSASLAFNGTPQNKQSARKDSSRQATSAKALFMQTCAKCHGVNGSGETVAGEIAGAPNFRDREWQESLNDKRMMVSIMHGRGGMPAFKSKLSQKEIALLISYVRSFKK